MLQAFTTLLILAVICEAIVNWLKEPAAPWLARLDQRDPALVGTVDRGAALAVGILLAAGTSQNLLANLAIEFRWPWIGIVLSGIVISRGANGLHDLLHRIGLATELQR